MKNNLFLRSCFIVSMAAALTFGTHQAFASPIETVSENLETGSVSGADGTSQAGKTEDKAVAKENAVKKTGIVSVNDGYTLNVRTGAWGDKIGKLNDGDKVDIVGEDGDWYKISYKGGTAYVHKDYIKLSGSSASESSDNSASSQKKTKSAESGKNKAPAAPGEDNSASSAPSGKTKGSQGGILDVPERAQRAPENGSIGSSLCGPTSLAMALEFYGINKPTRTVAKETKTLSSSGAWQGTCCENIAAAAKKNLPGSYLKSNMSIDDLKNITASGKPVAKAKLIQSAKSLAEKWDNKTVQKLMATGDDGKSALITKLAEKLPKPVQTAVSKAMPMASKAGKVLGWVGVVTSGANAGQSALKAMKGCDPNNPAEVVSYTTAKYDAIYGGIDTAVQGLGMVSGPVGIGFTAGKLVVDGVTSLMGEGTWAEGMKRYSTMEALNNEYSKWWKYTNYLTTKPEQLVGDNDLTAGDLGELRTLIQRYKPPEALMKKLVYMREFMNRIRLIANNGGTVDDAAIKKIMDELAKKSEEAKLDKQVETIKKLADMNNVDLDTKMNVAAVDIDRERENFEKGVNDNISKLEEKYNNSRTHFLGWGETKFAESDFGKSIQNLKNKVFEKKGEYVELMQKAIEMESKLAEKRAQLIEKKAQLAAVKADEEKARTLAAEVKAIVEEGKKMKEEVIKLKADAEEKNRIAQQSSQAITDIMNSQPDGNAIVNL